MSKPVFVLLVTLALVAVFGKAEWQLEDRDELDKAIIKTLKLQHGEDIVPSLSIIKCDSKLSDNAFSERLVQLATAMTNGEAASFRSVAISVLGDFGTTNALNFLENEVRRGNIVAISEYGLIIGYDDRFFELAEPLVDDKRKETWGRREPVYNAFRSLLNKKDIRDREIPVEIRKRAIADLISWANEDIYYADYIDQILSEKEETYRTNAIRHAIARFALNNPESSDYTRNYFKNVLQQMGHALPKAEEGNSPKTASRETGKQTGAELAEPTSGRGVSKVNNPTSSEPVAADKPMTHAWHIIMVFVVLLFAATFFFARWLKRQCVNRTPTHQ